MMAKISSGFQSCFLGINVSQHSLNSSLGGQNVGLTDRANLIITFLRIINYKGPITQKAVE
jgi:hypothetical protein